VTINLYLDLVGRNFLGDTEENMENVSRISFSTVSNQCYSRFRQWDSLASYVVGDTDGSFCIVSHTHIIPGMNFHAYFSLTGGQISHFWE